MSDLWDRLNAAKGRMLSLEPEAARPEESPPKAPAGWDWVTPLVARRSFEFELESSFWDLVRPGISASDWEGVLCFDTETTGLSGGAGTVAFLVGWATLLDTGAIPRIRIEQFFLRDHPGERDLVAVLDPEFRRARALVSFNGASFDLPLLRTRWSLNGHEFPHRPHRDDLHPSRRLWKRVIDSCRLSRLEALVLGIHRRDDVPGALVPELWHGYLRDGALPDFHTPLSGVLRHHAQDVYSLLCLDLLLHSLRAEPSSPRWAARFTPWKPTVGLARVTEGGLLHPDVGTQVPVGFWGRLPLLEDSDRGSALEAAWDGRNFEVGLGLGAWYKSQGDPKALSVWTTLWEDQGQWVALHEALKWLEHRERTEPARAQALLWISRALERPFLPAAWRADLVKRQTRLLSRQARHKDGSRTDSSTI